MAPLSTTGLAVAGALGAAALGMTALTGARAHVRTHVVCTVPFVTPALRRHVLPYVPATEQQMHNVHAAVSQVYAPTPHTARLIDMGSGDGRVVSARA